MKREEIWKEIPSYNGLYEVSNNGRVRNSKGILKSKSKEGHYNTVNLKNNGKVRHFHVSQLVAMAFLGHTPCGHEMVVDHIDNDKTNNTVENLQVITQRENLSKDKSTTFTGAYWHKNNKKWMSAITIGNDRYHLGHFNTENEAAEAYKEALNTHRNGGKIVRKKKVRKNNSSNVLRNGNSWSVFIKINKKRIYICSSKSEEDANKIINSVKKLIDSGTSINKAIDKYRKVKKTSKFKGVYLDKSRGKWVSLISIKNKRKYLGSFDSESDAHSAYKKALLKK